MSVCVVVYYVVISHNRSVYIVVIFHNMSAYVAVYYMVISHNMSVCIVVIQSISQIFYLKKTTTKNKTRITTIILYISILIRYT